MINNISQVALGGVRAEEFSWTLEIESFSSFSYTMMRQNIFSLCIDDKYARLRDSIIYLKPSITADLQAANNLYN